MSADEGTATAAGDRADAEPFLRVLHGTPTDEELAALVLVLHSLGSAERAPSPAPVSGWAAYWRHHRRHLAVGPGAWRHSLRH